MAFKASTVHTEKEINLDNEIELYGYEEVETECGWKFVDGLNPGDHIRFNDDTFCDIINIVQHDNLYKIIIQYDNLYKINIQEGDA